MKKNMLLFFLIPLFGNAQEINIIPKPVEINPGKDSFRITPQTVIAYDEFTKNAALFLHDYLKKQYRVYLPLTMHNRNQKAILLMHVVNEDKKGFYKLECDKKGITIMGDPEGAFYGIQTLIQLLPVPHPKPEIKNQKLFIPQLTITDYPRFSYRGMHLDVGRHFFPVSFIKKYIDYLALHKLNYFHWHLTEDQGWRIEIKKYPNLTKTGAWRNGTLIGRYPGSGNDNIPYGGFYTQDEVKEIVKYAADRFITVIPEIELPGHSSAAIAAYPWLSCFPDEPTAIPASMISNESRIRQARGEKKMVQETWGVFDDVFCAGKDSTFTFLQDVFDEVLTLFPSKYIHVGGDECPKTNWKRCPACQARMKNQKLKDEHELQSYFIQRMEKWLNRKGRILIGWDEILEGGLAPNAVVMSWRGEQGGIAASKLNHHVIMTPGSHVYFDHTQSENDDSVTIGGFTPLEKVYHYEPIPNELNTEQAKYILGAQANVWTEYMKNTKKTEYMIFPRISALSEVLWTPKEKKDWSDFEKRLQIQFRRYELWKVNYSKAYFDLHTKVLPAAGYDGVLWQIESKYKEGYIGYTTTSLSSGAIKYETPILVKKSGLISAHQFINDKSVSSVIQQFHINKATGKKIILTNQPSQNYPGDGAFTLVNGVQNEKGLAKSKELLGFSGTDCEALIDLGTTETMNEIIIHTLSSGGSRVYPPKYAEAFVSTDGVHFSSAGKAEKFEITGGSNGIVKIICSGSSARYIKVFVKNFGIIPDGMRGAGNPAWLFVDEIEVR